MTEKMMSSANDLDLTVGPNKSAMSFTKIMNKIGPKTLPWEWGIPLKTGHVLDLAIPIQTVF